MVDEISAAKEPDRKMSGSRHFRSFLCEAALDLRKYKWENVKLVKIAVAVVAMFQFFL